MQRRIGRHRPYEVSWEYIGRPRRAAPSEGYHGSHVIEQERVLRTALETSPAVQAHLAGSGSAPGGPATVATPAAPGESSAAAPRVGRRR